MRIDAANTAWVLVSAALVMFMTPGLALFYGGMVRAKNVLPMLAQNFFSLGLGAFCGWWSGLAQRSRTRAVGGEPRTGVEARPRTHASGYTGARSAQIPRRCS